MKNLKNTIKNKIADLKKRAKRAAARAIACQKAAQLKLAENEGQFVMDNAMVFVIILLVGAIVVTAFGNLITNDLIPSLRTKIMDFFS